MILKTIPRVMMTPLLMKRMLANAKARRRIRSTSRTRRSRRTKMRRFQKRP